MASSALASDNARAAAETAFSDAMDAAHEALTLIQAIEALAGIYADLSEVEPGAHPLFVRNRLDGARRNAMLICSLCFIARSKCSGSIDSANDAFERVTQ